MILTVLLGLLWLVPAVAVWLWFKPEEHWNGFVAPEEGKPEPWKYALVMALCVAVPFWNIFCAIVATFPKKTADPEKTA